MAIPANFVLTLDYNGTEKLLGDCGFATGVSMTLVNQGSDTFSCVAQSGDLTLTPIVPFGGRVKIYARSLDADGQIDPDSGQIIFQGERIQLKNSASKRSTRHYTFANGWYDLEQRPYLQRRCTSAVIVAGVVQKTYGHTSELVLFYDISDAGVSNQLTIGEQLEAILQYAIDHGAAFQIGTIDPLLNDQAANTYQVKDIKCAEALQMCLRSSPQAVVWWDYSTETPTVNVSLTRTPVTLPWADGVKHFSSEIIPRPDLQLACVLLIFKTTNDLNGTSFATYTSQKFPDVADLEFSRATLIQTIDLAGFRSQVETAPLAGGLNNFAAGGIGVGASASDADNATRRAWWAQFDSKFANEDELVFVKFDNANLSVTDDNGDPINLATYPRYIVSGSPASWMKVGTAPLRWIKANVTVKYSAMECDADGFPYKTIAHEHLSQNLTLTNATLGNNIYSATITSVAAEPEPPGLAEYIYDQMAALQHEGKHITRETSWTNSVLPVHALSFSGEKLTGDLSALTGMNAPVQTVNIDFYPGCVETAVAFGPAKHLGAGDLTQLFLINRNRQPGNGLGNIVTGQF